MLDVRAKHRFSGFQLDASFAAEQGITVLFGASGSGKSTLANVVAGLLKPEAGRVVLQGRVLFDSDAQIWVPPHRRRIGYVFQDARLFPHLSVRRNLEYGSWFRRARIERHELDRVVDMLDLKPVLQRRPALLSGGEKQRVAIGRALLSGAEMLIADEPLAALDQARKAEILPYFERLRDELAVPVLYVSHSSAEVARLATTVVAVSGGRVLRQGNAAEVFADPQVLPLGPRGAGAVLTATVWAHHSDGLTELRISDQPLWVPKLAQAPGTSVTIRIAAHDVILARSFPKDVSALNILPGSVAQIRTGDGPGAIVALNSTAGPFLARITKRSLNALGLKVGTECFAIIKSVSINPEDVS